MPIAQGRRLSVTIDPDIDGALQTIATYTKQPVATVLRGLLREALPGLEAMAEALELVEKSPKRAALMMVGEADRQMGELQQALLPLRQKRGRKPKG